MNTILIVAALVAFTLVLIGAVVAFTWLCAMAAGRAVGYLMGVQVSNNETGESCEIKALLSQETQAHTAALVADSQRMLHQSEQRTDFAR